VISGDIFSFFHDTFPFRGDNADYSRKDCIKRLSWCAFIPICSFSRL